MSAQDLCDRLSGPHADLLGVQPDALEPYEGTLDYPNECEATSRVGTVRLASFTSHEGAEYSSGAELAQWLEDDAACLPEPFDDQWGDFQVVGAFCEESTPKTTSTLYADNASEMVVRLTIESDVEVAIDGSATVEEAPTFDQAAELLKQLLESSDVSTS